MSKKVVCILVVMVFLVALVAACQAEPTAPPDQPSADTPGGATQDPTPAPPTTPDEPPELGGEMAPLVISGFVGDPNQYQREWISMFEEMFPELGAVETVISDTTSRPIVLRTAIAAGDPPSIGNFWGTRVNTFFDLGMCLDLRPFFTQAELDLFNPSLLQPAIGNNGEVFAIPTTTVYFTIFYNRDLFTEWGLEIPQTWDELTAIFERAQQEGMFGFAVNTQSLQDAMVGLAYAEWEALVGPGTSYGFASGEVSVLPGTPAGEVLRSVIEQYVAWYDAGYMYPGEGAISVSMDEANAAFARGASLMQFTFSGAFHALDGASDFQIGSFLKPPSTTAFTALENIEPTVYFVPSNVSEAQLNSSVAFLRLALTHDLQQRIVDSNNIPSIPSFEFTDMSPVLGEIISVLETGQLIAGLNPVRASTEMFNFVKEVIFTGPMAGIMTADDVLTELERIRIDAFEEMQRAREG